MDEWFKDTLVKIDTKLDRIDTRVDYLEVNSAEITADLKYHIKRTDMLEDELKPIKTKYEQMVGVGKFFGAVFAIVSVLETVIHLFLK